MREVTVSIHYCQEYGTGIPVLRCNELGVIMANSEMYRCSFESDGSIDHGMEYSTRTALFNYKDIPEIVSYTEEQMFQLSTVWEFDTDIHLIKALQQHMMDNKEHYTNQCTRHINNTISIVTVLEL